MTEFFDIGKDFTGEKEAGASFLLELLEAIDRNPFYEIVELKSVSNHETIFNTIIVDVGDGTVPPNNETGIKRTETLALIWNQNAESPLDVRALRKDFPTTLHQNGVAFGDPKSLCLFEHSWKDLEHKITPALILERILWWLRNAAENTIHPDSQPIEQLFYAAPYRLIIPDSLLADIADKGLSNSFISIVSSEESKPIIMRLTSHIGEVRKNINHISIVTKAIVNSPIKYAPNNLEELDKFFEVEDYCLKNAILSWFRENVGNDGLKKEHGIIATMLLIIVPRIRDGIIERHDTLAFFTPLSLCELGFRIGALLPPVTGEIYYFDHFKNTELDRNQLVEIKFESVSVIKELTKLKTQKISKIENLNCNFKGILAGVGALGSHLAELWARQSWGQWTYIDNDVVLPHNLTRHIALDQHIGRNKAEVVSSYIKCIFDPASENSHLPYDITSENKKVLEAISNSYFILDVTTSILAPRNLSRRKLTSRIASAFLTPSGNDSVLLLESADKKVDILCAENQYYRALIDSSIEGSWAMEHLKENDSPYYGLGCRSPSVSFPVDNVVLHSANISLYLKKNLDKNDAAIIIWRILANGEVSKINIPVYEGNEIGLGKWTIVYDQLLMSKLSSIRNEKLPLETGGAIFGMVDHKLKIIAITYVSNAPTDSSHSNSYFVRGKEGMLELHNLIVERTGGMIDYIGEWHSHPKEYKSNPSPLDKKLINKISSSLKTEGKPAIMLIISESDISITIEKDTCVINL
ncbi:ThiF family adenylyltransferase [Klebsiella variicola]